MPRASVGVGPVRVGSGCCVTALGIMLVPVLAVVLLTGAATASPSKQYVLKHPKHERCKTHYRKKIEMVTRHERGHRVKLYEDMCIYVLTPTVDPPAITPASILPVPAIITSPETTTMLSTPAPSPKPTQEKELPKEEPVQKEPAKEKPIKEEPKKEKPTGPFATTTALNQISQECGEEIKERLMPYAKVNWCKYDVVANTADQYGETPKSKTIWFYFPDQVGYSNFEFQAELEHHYEVTIELTKELDAKGEITGESCIVGIDVSLYVVRELSNCHHLTITASFSDREDYVHSEGELLLTM